MNLPKSWNDVTLSQYIEITKIINGNSNFESQLELVGVLADLPIEDIENLDIDEFKTITDSITFIQSEPSKRYVNKISDLTFKPFNKLKVGEFIDIEHYITKDYIENLPVICAILYKQTKIDEWNNLIYEPYKYELEERESIFLDVSINQTYGVVSSYIEWRENFLNTYSNLFEEPVTEDELEDVDPEDRKELEKEMKQSKWSWEKTIYILANEDVSKMQDVLDMNLIFAFNMLSMKKDTES